MSEPQKNLAVIKLDVEDILKAVEALNYKLAGELRAACTAKHIDKLTIMPKREVVLKWRFEETITITRPGVGGRLTTQPAATEPGYTLQHCPVCNQMTNYKLGDDGGLVCAKHGGSSTEDT